VYIFKLFIYKDAIIINLINFKQLAFFSSLHELFKELKKRITRTSAAFLFNTLAVALAGKWIKNKKERYRDKKCLFYVSEFLVLQTYNIATYIIGDRAFYIC